MLRKQIKKFVSLLSVNGYETLNRIELNQANLLANLDFVQKQHASDGVIPVLKANAYGHGLTQIATILNKADCTFLAVDGYFEAATIRDITKHPILVLGYIKPVNVRLLDTQKCSFVVQDQESLEAFGRLGKPVRIHVELNTGMNRLGLSAEELDDYLKTVRKFPNIQLEGVMTHLADADNEDSDLFTEQQVKQFDRMLEKIMTRGFKPKYVHVAQTAGSTKAKSSYANCIRLGIGLYGINPLGELDKHYQELENLKPVLELKSTIIKVIDLKKGAHVSYNGIYTAPKDMKIGVLPIGYYEGVPRDLSNKGTVTSGGLDMLIVGRVCMNHTMIELNDPNTKVGDVVVIISSDRRRRNSIKQICKERGLFSYVLVTKLSSSVRRVIV